MELKDIKPCPFCGGVVIEHPNKSFRKLHYVVSHKKECFMRQYFPGDIDLTPGKYVVHLLPKKGENFDKWNERNG